MTKSFVANGFARHGRAGVRFYSKRAMARHEHLPNELKRVALARRRLTIAEAGPLLFGVVSLARQYKTHVKTAHRMDRGGTAQNVLSSYNMQ